MKKLIKEVLPGAVLVSAIGLAPLGWAQQHDHGAQAVVTDSSSTTTATDSGQVFGSDQLDQQDQSEMPHGQGNMMQRGQSGDGQGNMMQRGQSGDGQGNMMQRMRQMRMRMGGNQSSSTADQDAFSAISAVVKQLEANPETDWSNINIDALRNHLIDMHEVTVNAKVESTEVAGGANYRVTGSGRTLEAIRNMVPMHAAQMTGETGWTAVAEEITDGVAVTVTADSDEQVVKIRALGFMGFMVSGEHHEMHHLAIVGAEIDSMSEGEGGHDH